MVEIPNCLKLLFHLIWTPYVEQLCCLFYQLRKVPVNPGLGPRLFFLFLLNLWVLWSVPVDIVRK